MSAPSLHLEIEATSLCNTRCLHCPHEALSRPSGTMRWSTYQTIMDKVMAYTRDIRIVFCGFGEPLLNPSIYDFIAYAAHTARTSIITNGAALTRRNIERLVDAGIDAITLSFNGADKPLYELMMGGLDFERARRNLHDVVALTNETPTHVAANVAVTRQTQGQLRAIRSFLEDAGVRYVYFSKCHNRAGFLQGDLVCNTPMPPIEQDRCDILKNILFVAWTGQILSCYHDIAGANLIGDLTVEPVETIHRRRLAIVARGVDFALCRQCNDMYRYCDARMPDERPLSEWIYDLYVEGPTAVPRDMLTLPEWLFAVGEQEGLSHRYFRALMGTIARQGEELTALRQENESLRAG